MSLIIMNAHEVTSELRYEFIETIDQRQDAVN
jgi:hypothetical protein